jgi:hypothetical protein
VFSVVQAHQILLLLLGLYGGCGWKAVYARKNFMAVWMSRLAQAGGGVGRRAGGGILADFAWFCSLLAARSCNPLISLRYEVLHQDFDTVLGY